MTANLQTFDGLIDFVENDLMNGVRSEFAAERQIMPKAFVMGMRFQNQVFSEPTPIGVNLAPVEPDMMRMMLDHVIEQTGAVGAVLVYSCHALEGRSEVEAAIDEDRDLSEHPQAREFVAVFAESPYGARLYLLPIIREGELGEARRLDITAEDSATAVGNLVNLFPRRSVFGRPRTAGQA